MPDSHFRNEVNRADMIESKRTKRQVTMVGGWSICEDLTATRVPKNIKKEEKEGKIGNISW
jgi:hypothetical protein